MMPFPRSISVVAFFILLASLKMHCIHSNQLIEMSLEEGVAQILVTQVDGKKLTSETKKFLKQVPLGGIILYNWLNELTSIEETRAFTDSIRKFYDDQGMTLPWFFIDQEGGRVTHLQVSSVPSPREVAKAQDPYYAQKVAHEIAESLYQAGIDHNLAPVVDLDLDPRFPYRERTFSSSPQQVTNLAEIYLKAFKQRQVEGCLKHFPGHGRTPDDSHDVLPRISASFEDLWKMDLFPYRALKEQATCIMTAHLFVPAIDKDQPITFSKSAVTDLLQGKIGYHGVIMTDSLIMEGILQIEPSITEVAIKAFLAGHDLLLLGGKKLLEKQEGGELSVEKACKLHQELVAWFLQNPIYIQQLESSLTKILQYKKGFHAQVRIAR